MLEAHSEFLGGRHVYFAGEMVRVRIEFHNSSKEREETVLWTSAQLYSLQSLAKRYVNLNAVSLGRRASSYSSGSPSDQPTSHLYTSFLTPEIEFGAHAIPTTNTGMVSAMGISHVYTLTPEVLCCDVKLKPGETSNSFYYTAQIPYDCLPSNSGIAVRVSHRVTLSFQRKDGTVTHLNHSLRVFVLPTSIYSIENDANKHDSARMPGDDDSEYNTSHSEETDEEAELDGSRGWLDVIPALDSLSEQVKNFNSFDDGEGIFRKVIDRANSRLRHRDKLHMLQMNAAVDSPNLSMGSDLNIAACVDEGLVGRANSRVNQHAQTQGERVCVTQQATIGMLSSECAERENIRVLKRTLQRLHAHVAHGRVSSKYRICNGDAKVGTFTMFRPSYCLGEEVMGQFDFTGAVLSTYMVKVSLEATETVLESLQTIGQPKPQPTHVSSLSLHTHNVARAQLRLNVPLSATPSYETDMVEYQWCLHIEFTTAKSKKDSYKIDLPNETKINSLNAITTDVPARVAVQSFSWRLPIIILPTNPFNIDEYRKPLMKLF
eukprot:CFRG8609T1